MLTVDGRVKIVDFGLAKTAEVEPALAGGPSATQTAAGLIMGTVPYMSPEQARGSPADFPSDQFALGVMLYEMTTATHPFKRETGVQTLSAIIADEPPDPAELAPSLPVPVRWLIRRLLAKAPRERYAHTADLAAELRTIRGHSRKRRRQPSRLRARPRRWLIPAAGGAGRRRTTARSGAHATAGPSRIRQVHPVRYGSRLPGRAHGSPDGKLIAYQAGSRRRGSRSLRAHLVRPHEPKSRNRASIATSPGGQPTGTSTTIPPRTTEMHVSDQPGARRQAGTRHRDVAVDHFTIRQDGLFPPQRRDGVATTFWSKTLPDGKEERYARGALANRVGSGGLCVSPRTGHACCWMGSFGRDGTWDFWDIALPDGEPLAVMPGIAGRASRRRFSAGCLTTGTCW